MTREELFEKTQKPMIDLAAEISILKHYDYNQVIKYHKDLMEIIEEYDKALGC